MRWIVPVLIAGVAIACGSFGSDADPDPPAPPVDAGGTDASTIADGEAPPDGALVDAQADAGPFDLAVRPACPRPAALQSTCVASGSCNPTPIFTPPMAEHPAGIAIDARHVYWLSFPGGVDGYNGNGPAVLRRLDRVTKEVVEIARDQREATKLLANGPYLYWTATGTGTTELRILRKDAPACEADGCGGSIRRLAFGAITPITRLAMPAPDALFVMYGNGTLVRVGLTAGTITAVASTTDYPSLTAGAGEVFATGAKQTAVLGIAAAGNPKRTLGSLVARDSGAGFVGAQHLATDCTHVYAFATDRTIDRHPISSVGGTFQPFSALPAMDVFAVTSDARFLYVGAANGGGLVALDTTANAPVPVNLASGSIWDLDVTDDAIAFGDHGANPSDVKAGAILLIEK